MKIDAHQHFWKYDPADHGWIGDNMKVIRKDFHPADLQPILIDHGFDGCVTVQVDQTIGETDLLILQAKANHFIKGVVGWIDLKADDIEDQLDSWQEEPSLKGFRHIAQGLPAGFLLQKDFLRGVGMLERFGFTYDILVYHNQLPEAISFARKFPHQRFILDHLAKPQIREGITQPWADHIRELAALDNVYCKLSGMVTEASWSNWKPADFLPYLDVVFEAFGSTRICYGSDWPVCLVAAEYKEQLHLIEEYISLLSASEKTAVMGANAVHFYNL